jgi:alpha-L-rhamnosidase
MNSLNHYAYGSVGDWVYQTVGGLRPCPDHPGFEHIVMDPRPGGSITSAWTEYDSARGPVRLSWELGERFEVTASVPAASWATLRLPCSEPAELLRDGQPLSEVERASCDRGEDGRLVLRLEPGTHRISAPRP